MAIFESLANALKVLAVGHRVKVTLRPETGRFPNPMEGHITEKDEAGNLSLELEDGVWFGCARRTFSRSPDYRGNRARVTG